MDVIKPDIKPTPVPETPKPVEPDTSEKMTGTALPPEAVYKLKEHFEIPYSDYRDNEKINFFIEFFNSHGITSIGEMLMRIRNIEISLGQTTNRLSGVYRYLRLSGQIDELAKIRDSLHGR